MSALERPISRADLSARVLAAGQRLIAQLDTIPAHLDADDDTDDELVRLLDVLASDAPPLKQRPHVRPGLLSPPYWRAPMPDAIDAVYVPRGYSHWSRRGFTGPVWVLDRIAAYLSAAATVEVSHGQMYHAGGGDPLMLPGRDGRPAQSAARKPPPGIYLITVHPWPEGAELPSPLGAARVGSRVWVTAERLHLLLDLAQQDRWPDATVDDAWVDDVPVRLSAWTDVIKTLRARYPDGDYRRAVIKIAFGQALQVMGGTRDLHTKTRQYRSPIWRPDWLYTIQDNCSATLWRRADACLRHVPHLGPVALQHVDELVLPKDAYPIVSRPPVRAGRDAKATIVIDPHGTRLGAFRPKYDGPVDWPMPPRRSSGGQ